MDNSLIFKSLSNSTNSSEVGPPYDWEGLPCLNDPFFPSNCSYDNDSSIPDDNITSSHHNITSPDHITYPIWYLTLFGSIACAVILITILGNLIVLMSFILERSIRHPTNYFIASLAVSDLLIGTISMPLYTVYLLSGKRWVLGEFLCDLWLSIDYTACLCSIYTVFCITADRFCSVKLPAKYRRWRTENKIICIILLTWIIPIALFFPSIFGWQYIVGKRTIPEGSCSVQYMEDALFNCILQIGYFWITLIAMVCLYAGIYKVALDLHKRSRAQQEKTMNCLVSMAGQTVTQIGSVMSMSCRPPASTSSPGNSPNKKPHSPTKTPMILSSPLVPNHDEKTSPSPLYLSPPLLQNHSHSPPCIKKDISSDTSISNIAAHNTSRNTLFTSSFESNTAAFAVAAVPEMLHDINYADDDDADYYIGYDDTYLNNCLISRKDSIQGNTQNVAEYTSNEEYSNDEGEETECLHVSVTQNRIENTSGIVIYLDDCTDNENASTIKAESEGSGLSVKYPSVDGKPSEHLSSLSTLQTMSSDSVENDSHNRNKHVVLAKDTLNPGGHSAIKQNNSNSSSNLGQNFPNRVTLKANPQILKDTDCTDTDDDWTSRSKSSPVHHLGVQRGARPLSSETDSDSMRDNKSKDQHHVTKYSFRGGRSNTSTSTTSVRRRLAQSTSRTRKALRTISIILGAFVICWIPWHIFSMIIGFCTNPTGCFPDLLYDISYWLCYLNSPINPFCYAFVNPQFKRTFLRLLKLDWRTF